VDGPAGAARTLALGQGLWWAATGVWPLVHLPSFEAITGRKRDRWLVRTVGVLVLAVGGTLALAARARRVTPELRLLALASAAGLGAIDVAWAGPRRAPYLADAAFEAALVAGWLWSTGGPRGAGEEGAR
jgi:hypothetical protein